MLPENAPSCTIPLSDAAATEALGRHLAHALGAGDTLLLSGAIGTGKTHLARALITERLLCAGERPEDVPSPTFTLVQSYRAGPLEIWHADLYRLSGPDEVQETGLADAFGSNLCIVEWPDRLGPLRPASALAVELVTDGDGRSASLSGPAAPAICAAFAGDVADA
jgi:tRNA threonylcarbamoyladenosine biosynthesis protein TsaE